VLAWCSVLIGGGLWLPVAVGRGALLAAAPLLPHAAPPAWLHALAGQPGPRWAPAAAAAAAALGNATQARPPAQQRPSARWLGCRGGAPRSACVGALLPSWRTRIAAPWRACAAEGPCPAALLPCAAARDRWIPARPCTTAQPLCPTAPLREHAGRLQRARQAPARLETANGDLRAAQAGGEAAARALGAAAARGAGGGPGAGAGAPRALPAALERMLAELEAQAAGPGVADWLCLAVGYCLLAQAAALAAALALAWNVARRRRGWAPAALRARAEPYVRRALVRTCARAPAHLLRGTTAAEQCGASPGLAGRRPHSRRSVKDP